MPWAVRSEWAQPGRFRWLCACSFSGDAYACAWENGDMPKVTEVQVNGTRRRLNADAERTLLSVLRDGLDLTGTKYGCGEGQCGACTVLIDGMAAHSCRVKVGTAAG